MIASLSRKLPSFCTCSNTTPKITPEITPHYKLLSERTTNKSSLFKKILHNVKKEQIELVKPSKAHVRPYLEKHMRVHTNERLFECSTCFKKFTSSAHLKRHMLVHSVVFSFECSICGKKCSQASNLKKHMLVHTGELPYECLICYKKFTQSAHLKTHAYSHRRKTLWMFDMHI